MEKNNKEIKEIFKNKPPYVLKLSSNFENIFRNKDSLNFKNSNAYYAIEMSLRQKTYIHSFTVPTSKISPLKKNFIIFYFKRLLKPLKIFFIKIILSLISYLRNNQKL